jgi:hypothetical protein
MVWNSIWMIWYWNPPRRAITNPTFASSLEGCDNITCVWILRSVHLVSKRKNSYTSTSPKGEPRRIETSVKP